MAYPERTVPSALSPGALTSASTTATRLRSWTAIQPLLWPLAAGWMCYLWFAVLSESRAFRVYDAGWLPYLEPLRRLAYTLAPNALLNAAPSSGATPHAVAFYVFLMVGAVASWCCAMRIARRLEITAVWPLLVLTALLSVPMVWLPGLFSDDVYLYNLYGRTIHVYGANPLLQPPSSFAGDAHLPWVHWKETRSAYGPVWLILSAALSRFGVDSLSAVVIAYRVAAAALHLATAALLWSTLRASRPRTAAADTLFYAWNPLVLLEVVGNAHNDVLVALFVVLLVTAAMRHSWSAAAFFAACAVMVKPYTVILLAPLARQILLCTPGPARHRRLAVAGVVAGSTMVLLSLPLWAGPALLVNVLNNPASAMYTNTIWELLSEIGPAWLGIKTVAIQHPYLDLLRAACVLGGAWWVLTRPSARRNVPHMALRMWLLFCLTACWVWPWYFVPALVLAPLAGPARLPAAMALTVGGLLFWTAWPPRTAGLLESLHFWRSLILFGPVLMVLIWAPARDLAFVALGLRRRSRRGRAGASDVQLQTAAG